MTADNAGHSAPATRPDAQSPPGTTTEAVPRRTEVSGSASEPSGERGKPVPAGSLGSSFWWLWTSSSLSNLADGILKIALPLVAVQLTRSPTLIAGLTVALTLPWLFFALPAGALADRLDRRRAMIGANLVRVTVLAGLVVSIVFDVGSIWVLYAIALCIGITETIYDTSAQSIMPQVVRRDQLPRANGRLYAAELTTNEFVGPPLAGVLAVAGAAVAFAAPVGLWAAAVAALLLVRGRFRVARTKQTTMRADIAEGLRFLWNRRLLRTLAVLVGMHNFAANAVFAVLVLYAVGPESALGLSAPAFGLLMTATAAGGLAGSFIAEWVERTFDRGWTLAATILCGAIQFGVLVVTTDLILIAAAFFLGGAATMIWNVLTVSLRQRIVPDHLLGRVNSGYRLLAWGTMPLGAAMGGILAQLFGLSTVFLVMTIVLLAKLIGMRGVTTSAIVAAEQQANPTEPSR
ncbi:MFS transporter [Actinoalloteichus hymeniacidonis]|nr:MFS transporter [Actinoalloteichus hymeniacidonis]MBB5907819.1 MFS family permease [Actinoalloteichus hymeniacidonis]